MQTKIESIEENLSQKADKAKVDTMAADLCALQNKLDAVCGDVSKLHKQLTFVQSEPEEIAKRLKNIVIRGIPESADLDSAVRELLNNIGCSHITPQETIRLGKLQASNQNKDAADEGASISNPQQAPRELGQLD